MSVSTTIAQASFNWTGVETSFSCGFPVEQLDDVDVVSVAGGVETPLTRGVHYGATLAPGSKLVTLTPIALPTAPKTIVARRNSELLQPIVFVDGEAIPAAVHQALHDGHVLRDQELQRDINDVRAALGGDYADEANAAAVAAQTAQAATEGARDDTLTAKADTLAVLSDAEAARDKAQEWAESPTEPGVAGTKSSKTWSGVAEGHAADAVAAQAGAEAARDAAFVNAHVYPDIATGRAAVADGAQFLVRDGLRNVQYQRTSSTTQDYVTSYLTAEGSYSPDIWRIKQKRAETAKAGGLYSAYNRQITTNIELRSATHNADGTITIPSGDYIMSERWGALYSGGADAADPTKWFYLHVSVADLSGAGVYLDAKSRAIDYTTVIGGGGLITGTVTTQTAPGCQKFALRNNTNAGGTAWPDYRYFIHNQTADPITIYPPVYTTDDIAYLPIFITGVDREPVEPLLVRDKDWTKLFTSSRAANFRASKAVTKASDSVNGLSGNAGTVYAPKQTLAQMGAFSAGDVIGLYRGSTWRSETLQLYPNTLPGIEIIDVCFGALGRLPKTSAFVAVPDGSWTDNLDGTYSYSYTSVDSLIDSNVLGTLYDEVYPIRIDTTLSAVDYPITREERPIKKFTQADCIATADSYYVTGSGTSWTMMIHPIDGAAPGTRYTFEVITKYYNAYFNPFTYNASLRGVWMSGSGQGYGPLAPGKDFYGERFIITHGNTHAIVWQDGLLENFMVYGRGGPNMSALVAYTTNATGRRAAARNFYLLGIAGSGIYMHNSGGDGQAWESGRFENGVIIGTGRQANGGLLPASAVGGNNVKDLRYKDMFIEGFGYGTGTSVGVAVTTMENLIFNQVSTIVSSNLFQNNIACYENFGDPINVNNKGVKMIASGAGKITKKNLLYAKFIDQGAGTSDPGCTALSFTGNNITFRQNIIIFGAGWAQINWLSGLNSGYSGMDIDYNIYIHVSGIPSAGGTQFTTPQNRTWEEYLATNGGIDQNSLYVDLRNDIRGVKAAFVDPDNMNFQIANTGVGRAIRGYISENDVGPNYVITRRPNVPTADEVARMIEHL